MDPINHHATFPNMTGHLDNIELSSNEDQETNHTAIHFEVDIMIQKVSFSIYSIIFILGIIGNGLVIWIAGFRMKKTISAVWFLNLAIADLLCCASIPLLFVVLVYHSESETFVIHVLFDILIIITMNVSVFILTAVSIDRWVSVMWPFWAKVYRTQKLARIIVAIIWVVSVTLNGSVYYYYLIYIDFRVSNYTAWTIHLIRFIIMFLIPFIIITTCYVTIFLKLRKSKRPQRSRRPYRIITAVILCFFICWAPYYTWGLTPKYYIFDIQSQIVITILICLAYLNSCINPIIYVFMGQDFRHNFLRSIPFRVEKALSENHNDPYKEEDLEPTPTTDD
ncbi:C3a anaphylatoxin chemotactic receptor-like [Engystomops pustulosus]|uniref:C3a anaphylatoxin chemotactic receptor-like n=1 Tax=Engystomops pustulosus TaxID=76066 RepID=UPI003AFA5ABB